MGIDSFQYAGKRALVIGGASGMGAATAKVVGELGAAVTVLDIADVPFAVERSIRVDLRDKNSVDAAVDSLEGPYHAVFACAGVADGTGGLMLINFISQRHILERLLDREMMPRGSAIAMISSVAGLGWEMALPTLKEFLDTPDWESAAKWVTEHDGTDSYIFSKQAMNAFIARQAFPLLQRGIRINGIEPGPTDTPLARANEDLWLGFAREYNEAAGVGFLTPQQMANVMAFLCTPAASGMTGVSFLVDQGQINSGTAGSYGGGGG
jgi:NAD(P)-dependent dehydrogenase (short-subunit alcohol dehydrogenase family)